MGQAIQKLYQSRSETELTEIAGQFEKIAQNQEMTGSRVIMLLFIFKYCRQQL
jgi:hypothetical protein